MTRLNVRFRPVEDISLDAARQSWPHHPMTNDRSGPDRMHGTLLLAAGCLIAAIVIGATLILPGMLSWSPGLLGLGATVGMALAIRRGPSFPKVCRRLACGRHDTTPRRSGLCRHLHLVVPLTLRPLCILRRSSAFHPARSSGTDAFRPMDHRRPNLLKRAISGHSPQA